MGRNGTHGPRPYRQTKTSTLFLRVPVAEWPQIKRGLKHEFRAPSGQQSQLFAIQTPTPIVAYAVNKQGQHDARLMVLERKWREPLGAISEQSLKAEGCSSLAEFRRQWMIRDRRRFTPTRIVTVCQVRPWRDGLDEQEMGAALLEQLYGDWVGAA